MEIDQLQPNKVQHPEYYINELEWYGCNLNRIAERYGTPLHVGCTEAVSDAFRAFRTPFEKAGVSLSVYYSVKTNPLPAYLNQLHQLGCGFEIVGNHESGLLKKLNVPPGNIIMTGSTNTGTRDSCPYFPETMHMITVSSLGQLRKLAALHPANGNPIRVAITICPELWRANWDITLNTSRKKGSVGVNPVSTQFDELLTFISETPGLHLTGLHMHLGSAIRSAAPYQKGIKALEKAAIRAAERGLRISTLNIGGGFSLASAPMLKVRNIVSSLLGLTNDGVKEQPDFLSQLASIAGQLNKTVVRLEKQGIRIKEIAAEPGRILSGPCQLMILTVKEVISRDLKHHYLICDGGAMSLSPMLFTEKHRISALTRTSGEEIQYEILGTLPSALDRVSASSRLPKIKAGQRIAVMDTGAYILSMNNTFNGPRPAVAWITDGDAELVRRRETLDNLYSMDVRPQELHKVK